MTGELTQWVASTVGKYAKLYTESGYKIFPTHGTTADLKCTCGNPECKNVGKHPFTANGLKDASDDLQQVATMFRYRTDLNIAIRTGEVSGFWVFDIDDKKGGSLSLNELCRIHGELPATKVSMTGNGYHIWFKYPGHKVVSRTDVFKGKYPGLDVRGDGGYICAPPSHHYSGKYYNFPEGSPSVALDAPEWLMEMLERVAEKKVAATSVSPDSTSGAKQDWSKDDVLDMLDVLDAGMGYDEWLHVGMALHHGGFPLSFWDNWSMGSSKYVKNEPAAKWKGFQPGHGVTMGTLVEMAKLKGWRPKPKERPHVDTTAVLPLVEKVREEKKQKSVAAIAPVLQLIEPKKERLLTHYNSQLPFDPMNIPGLIGDTIRWITKYAIFKHPELAMLNTLAFAGSVFGRRYASEINTRTNIYTVGIGNTAIGKDHSRKMLTMLAHNSDLGEFIGANAIRSDTGMLRAIERNASQLMMLDEFGKILKAVGAEKSPYHIQMISRVLLTLYSDSGSIYNHGDYADPKGKPIIIHAPNLCLYGTDTETSYIPALKKTSIENGELNRFIILPAAHLRNYPDKKRPNIEMDDKLCAQWQRYSKKESMNNLGVLVNSADVAPTPTKVLWGNCEDLQYDITCHQIDKLREDSPVSALWGRYYENTVKLAMIFAIARDKDEPVMTQEDFKYARGIVETSIAYISTIAREHMADSSSEDLSNKIVQEMRKRKGKIDRSDLLRKFRAIKKRDMDDILSGLLEQEVIQGAKMETGGRTKTVYFFPDVVP